MIYKNMNDKDKGSFLKKEYEIDKKSFGDIAKNIGTYANKIRRDAMRLNIKIRDKSEAQKSALSSGRIKHPTKGTKRSLETKEKIGLSVLHAWENIDNNEIEKRRLRAKASWDNKSDIEKQDILKQANAAVREAGKTGSKLEKFLLNKLLSDGWAVEFHKEQSILNTRLQIDLFVPKINVAIEIDGPSHFEPVWGDDALKRNNKYDDKKTGLIIGKGLHLIRIKQSKDFSKTRGLIVFQKLSKLLQDIRAGKLSQNKILKIGDE